MIEKKEFMEWAEYAGNLYGTPLKWVKNELKSGTDVILEIVHWGIIADMEGDQDRVRISIAFMPSL